MLTIFRNLFSPPRHLILLVIFAWIGLLLAEKRSKRNGISKEDLNNFTFYGLAAFIFGGRISFILQNIPTFFKSPLGVISVNPDLFDPLGAAVAALLIVFVYGQRRKLLFWNTLDSLTPFFAIISIGIGLSHLAAGTGFGKETDLSWGIYLWNATRHPTQIYETLTSFLIFSMLWYKKHDPTPGILFITFVMLAAGSQLIIQGFHGDSTLVFNNLRQEQIIGWVVLGICFLVFELRIKRQI